MIYDMFCIRRRKGADLLKRYKADLSLRDRFIPFAMTILIVLLGMPSVYAQEQQQQQPLLQQRKSLEEERLAIIKADIQKQIEYNEKLKKEIEAAQKTIDTNARERLMKVSKIYEAMPADEAAKRLEKLDEDTAVDILSVLKPRAAGGILGEMDNDKAASISKKIINKGKNPQEKTSP